MIGKAIARGTRWERQQRGLTGKDLDAPAYCVPRKRSKMSSRLDLTLVADMRAAGFTFQAIADAYGITRQAVNRFWHAQKDRLQGVEKNSK